MPTFNISHRVIDEIRDALTGGDVPDSLADTLLDEFSGYLDLCRCGRCSDIVSNCETNYIEDAEESWCESCTSREAHYWESDECYHTEPEPADEDREGIAGYHDTDRDELFDGTDWSNPALLGIEIETYCQSPSEDISRARVSSRGQSPAWTAEDDGSLDDRHGVELVFAPTTLEDIAESYGESAGLFSVTESLRKSGAIAWDAGTGYGMHVSVNASAMSELHCAKFIRMFCDNEYECTRLAGRKETNWAKYNPADKLSGDRKQRGKYLAAARRDNSRIEVRIFRSSLNKERILRNCELVDAVRVYTLDCSFGSLNFADFRTWLSRPEQSRYAALRKFYGFVNVSERTIPARRFASNVISE